MYRRGLFFSWGGISRGNWEETPHPNWEMMYIWSKLLILRITWPTLSCIPKVSSKSWTLLKKRVYSSYVFLILPLDRFGGGGWKVAPLSLVCGGSDASGGLV